MIVLLPAQVASLSVSARVQCLVDRAAGEILRSISRPAAELYPSRTIEAPDSARAT